MEWHLDDCVAMTLKSKTSEGPMYNGWILGYGPIQNPINKQLFTKFNMDIYPDDLYFMMLTEMEDPQSHHGEGKYPISPSDIHPNEKIPNDWIDDSKVTFPLKHPDITFTTNDINHLNQMIDHCYYFVSRHVYLGYERLQLNDIIYQHDMKDWLNFTYEHRN